MKWEKDEVKWRLCFLNLNIKNVVLLLEFFVLIDLFFVLNGSDVFLLKDNEIGDIFLMNKIILNKNILLLLKEEVVI